MKGTMTILTMFLLATPVFAQPSLAPCHTKNFKTEMYKQACTLGGQPGAKDAAKKFCKDHNIDSCNRCHTQLEPNYNLTPDGLTLYRKAGGK